MVRLEGETSDTLFQELENWNEILKDVNLEELGE